MDDLIGFILKKETKSKKIKQQVLCKTENFLGSNYAT